MAEPVERVSHEEYLRRREASEVKLEFVDGVVYPMTGGTVEHARLSASIIAALAGAIDSARRAVFSVTSRSAWN